MTAAMAKYTPGEIVTAVRSLADSDQHALRFIATMIAGSIISGELPLAGGNLLLDILGRPRVEASAADQPAQDTGAALEQGGQIMPGTPEWDAWTCDEGRNGT